MRQLKYSKFNMRRSKSHSGSMFWLTCDSVGSSWCHKPQAQKSSDAHCRKAGGLFGKDKPCAQRGLKAYAWMPCLPPLSTSAVLVCSHPRGTQGNSLCGEMLHSQLWGNSSQGGLLSLQTDTVRAKGRRGRAGDAHGHRTGHGALALIPTHHVDDVPPANSESNRGSAL